jgi:hypothetical protein
MVLLKCRVCLVAMDHHFYCYMAFLKPKQFSIEAPPALERVMHVDLDYVYDKDPVQQEKNLG